MHSVRVALALMVLAACTPDSPAELHDAGEDAGYDAGEDSAVDAHVELDSGASDAGYDGGHDAGPTCTCAGVSTCCDGCLPRNPGVACDDGNANTGNEQCAAGACVGTPCECQSGPCCDGCFFRAASYVCGTNVTISASCTGSQLFLPCQGRSHINHVFGTQYCPGNAATCSGATTANGTSTSYPCVGTGAVCRADAAAPLGVQCGPYCGP